MGSSTVPDDYPGRIVDLRRRLGLTQGQLAEAIGASSYLLVSRWERGVTRVSASNWAKLVRLDAGPETQARSRTSPAAGQPPLSIALNLAVELNQESVQLVVDLVQRLRSLDTM